MVRFAMVRFAPGNLSLCRLMALDVVFVKDRDGRDLKRAFWRVPHRRLRARLGC